MILNILKSSVRTNVQVGVPVEDYGKDLVKPGSNEHES